MQIKALPSVSGAAWSCLSPSVATWSVTPLFLGGFSLSCLCLCTHSPIVPLFMSLQTGHFQDQTTTVSLTLQSDSQERHPNWLPGSPWLPGLKLCVSSRTNYLGWHAVGVMWDYMAEWTSLFTGHKDKGHCQRSELVAKTRKHASKGKNCMTGHWQHRDRIAQWFTMQLASYGNIVQSRNFFLMSN